MTNFDPREKTEIVNSDEVPNPREANANFELNTDEPLPTRVGRYRVVNVLGKGGFGTVYLAEDPQLNRQVAIKVPHHELLTENSDAYLTEARVVASLDHEHIVPVYDMGSTAEHPVYIVSKYIEGVSLRARLRERRSRYDEAAQLVATIAAALHYAHTRGLVHRDVKPGNILLATDETPHVVDFGLALHEDDVGQGPNCAGTPAYMSPEQARGEGHRVDGRSDVFSLGIVFYEMLVGQKPFRGGSHTEILNQVEFHEPKPLRQFDDRIPRELERICYRAIEKRASERYLTAKDFADDLHYFLKEHKTPSDSTPLTEQSSRSADRSETPLAVTTERSAQSGSASFQTSEAQVHIVPKGLRSFDSHDADFFLSLVPGPRDRTGLPESLRFWKTQVEETDPEKTFSVGLVYGPSGCGKSSLMKAGLIPRLGYQVDTIYVEAAPQETEARLLQALRKRYPGIPADLSLKEATAALRRGNHLPQSQKVLIILDQFEQWLNSSRNLQESELVQALRQCDGGHVQGIVMVRDDFWMSVARFMRALEVRLVEGQNSAAVDLFDKAHAEKVLRAFGFAFGRLPERQSEMTADQKQFLKMAIDGLSREGRVICVRLAVFAEMMKGRASWSPATLRDVGGAQGLGANFLEETFNGASAPPERRYHQSAARAILRSLLPESSSNMKGHMRSEQDLMEVCSYRDRKADFDELLSILDGSLRLISAVDAAVDDGGTGRDSAGKATRHYQLAHDYLVGSIRDWLTHKQQETRRGRAELKLAERSKMWNDRPEAKQLPSFAEWLRISIWTRRQNRNESEQRMMQAATRLHGRNLLIGSAMLAVMIVAAVLLREANRDQQRRSLARARVQALMVADVREAPAIIEELHATREYSTEFLRQRFDDENEDSRGRLFASLTLLRDDASHAEFLSEQALKSSPETLSMIAEALATAEVDSTAKLWEEVQSDRMSDAERFRALCLLAQTDAENALWSLQSEFVARQLVAQTPLSFALQWSEVLRPARKWLNAPLAEIIRDSAVPETQRTIATSVMADFARNDPWTLTSLIIDATPQQFAVLLAPLTECKTDAVPQLRNFLKTASEVEWKDDKSRYYPPASPGFTGAVQAADGMLTEDFAFCQQMPLEQFRKLADDFTQSGYRPVSFRPYECDGQICVAAVWTRDGLKWHANYGGSAEDVRAKDGEMRAQKMWPVDVGYYAEQTPAGTLADRFVAVWAEQWPDVNDARMYVGVAESGHQDAWSPLVNDNFSVRTNMKVQDVNGTHLYNSVRWRLWQEPRCRDAWQFSQSEYSERSQRGWTQTDVRMSLQFGEDDQPAFAAAWWDGNEFETTELHGLSKDQHLTRCRELSAQGLRPWSISVVSPPSGTVAASVWARPRNEEHLDDVAERKANAAIALLHLGIEADVWPVLHQQPDPRLRALLIDRFADFDCPVEGILARLDSETDTSIRRALLLGLTSFNLESVDAVRRDAVVENIIQLFESDPDPGVHSACDLLLRCWGQSAQLEALASRGKSSSSSTTGRGWLVDGQGHTLAIVRGPVSYWMGSVPHTSGRNNYRETRHQRRIERSFAVATRETTVEQFQRFQPDVNFANGVTRKPDCPINGVSWFQAAQYCRWLSELEGIPESEMCFPPGDKIGPEMKLPDNYLSRTGYRLPTEAEWEYVCRAGTDTERHFGQTERLLNKHAWTIDNSRVDGEYRLHPVGLLRPNDFGLFDTLGNVMEWCQDENRDYPNVPRGTVTNDDEAGTVVEARVWRPVRGGAFLYQPSNARASHRDNSRPPQLGSTAPYVGFRVARTLPDTR